MSSTKELIDDRFRYEMYVTYHAHQVEAHSVEIVAVVFGLFAILTLYGSGNITLDRVPYVWYALSLLFLLALFVGLPYLLIRLIYYAKSVQLVFQEVRMEKITDGEEGIDKKIQKQLHIHPSLAKWFSGIGTWVLVLSTLIPISLLLLVWAEISSVGLTSGIILLSWFLLVIVLVGFIRYLDLVKRKKYD
ncbi:MAG: hypothetical protein H3Z52_04470 [archaeon]|nr:hypothetical protein [archaeon]MCP8320185.1 hypothetical protein [archaeon]